MSETAYISIDGNANATMVVNNGGILTMGPNTLIKGVGDFDLAGGASLSIGSADGITSGTTVSGNIQNTGGTRSFGTASNYSYAGTAAQVTGNGFPTNLTGTLTINNSSGVTLSTARTISTGSLNLTSGNLITTSTNLLTIGTAGTTTGASSSSFVNGPLAQTIAATGPTAKTFPIGKGTAYRLVDLTITQDAATSTIYTA